jgi:predicted regulator of Ras-like GTPase activity (Roadblock/LC7/MglB family)
MVAELDPETKKKLVKTLGEISRYCDLDALAVVTREGRRLAFFAQKGTDPDLLSAVSAAVTSTGTMVTEQLMHGDLWEVIVRGETGYTILSSSGEFVLIGASREFFSMGLAVRVLREYRKKIQKVLST